MPSGASRAALLLAPPLFRHQQRGNALCLDRPAVQIALHLVAAVVQQKVALLDRLDAFRDHPQLIWCAMAITARTMAWSCTLPPRCRRDRRRHACHSTRCDGCTDLSRIEEGTRRHRPGACHRTRRRSCQSACGRWFACSGRRLCGQANQLVRPDSPAVARRAGGINDHAMIKFY